MIKQTKSQALNSLCIRYNADKVTFKDISIFLQHKHNLKNKISPVAYKRHKRILSAGIYNIKKTYRKKYYSIYFWNLYNCGILIRKKYLKENEPKLFI